MTANSGIFRPPTLLSPPSPSEVRHKNGSGSVTSNQPFPVSAARACVCLSDVAIRCSPHFKSSIFGTLTGRRRETFEDGRRCAVAQFVACVYVCVCVLVLEVNTM